MTEDPQKAGDGGVLGNLPRSRPGRRSEKRDASKASGTRRKAAGRTSPNPRARPAQREPDQGGRGPLGGAVHAATTVVGTGARVAGALAHEVVRRLPRP